MLHVSGCMHPYLKGREVPEVPPRKTIIKLKDYNVIFFFKNKFAFNQKIPNGKNVEIMKY
jgi:hypothetical protein